MNLQNWLTEDELEEFRILLSILKEGATEGDDEFPTSKLPGGDEYVLVNDRVGELLSKASRRYQEDLTRNMQSWYSV